MVQSPRKPATVELPNTATTKKKKKKIKYSSFPLNRGYLAASLVAETVENPPATQETWVQSLGWEDPLEEGMGTHSSTLAWRNPWTEGPGGLQSMGLQRVRHN